MSSIDAVSIFAEGTFEEQIRELVNYLAQGRSDEEKASFTQPLEDALATAEGQKPFEEDEERRRAVFEKVVRRSRDLAKAQSERAEIEGFFNLFFAHFLNLLPLDSSSTKNISTLIQLASAEDELDRLQLSLPEVNKWLSEWEISSEEKSSYLKTLVDTYAQSEPQTSYEYQLAYVRSLPPSSSKSAALDLIASALRLPSVFDFDALFRLDAVVAAKDSELYSLLQIFLNDGLAEYRAWAGSHAAALTQYNLDQAQLERKIRVLSLTTLAFQNIGRDLSYSAIAEVLQVEPTEVERWVIDALSNEKTFHVIRASARAFERAQWEALESRLVAWKTGLASVRDVISATRKKNAPPSAVAAP
ncbi:hypothetical protein BC629DRAFT_1515435 [Irpex lacteus]|nr:hypothetical protein BC629DRAFT_1515435 [Irpex lacteus]